MGESQNPHFHDFGSFGRVPGSQNQVLLSLVTPGYLKEFKKSANHVWKYLFCKFHFSGHLKHEHIGKGPHPRMMKIRIMNC